MAVFIVRYDAKVIRDYAAAMYARARRVVVIYAVGFGLTGFAGGLSLGQTLSETDAGAVIFGLIACAAAALAGYLLGDSRAFALKLAAQNALCQLEIERNTRDIVAASSAPTATTA